MYPLSSPSLPPSHPPSLTLVVPPPAAQPSPGRSNVLGLRLPCDRVTLRQNDGTEVIAIDQTTLTASLYPLPPFLLVPPPPLDISRTLVANASLAPWPRIIPDERYFVPDLARNPYFSRPSLTIDLHPRNPTTVLRPSICLNLILSHVRGGTSDRRRRSSVCRR